MFNLVVLTGRLTADPELKTTPNGISVTTFSIAVSRRYRAGEEAQADFINIVAWRQTAEFVSKYFRKGSMIGIEVQFRPVDMLIKTVITAQHLRLLPIMSNLLNLRGMAYQLPVRMNPHLSVMLVIMILLKSELLMTIYPFNDSLNI